MSTGRRFLCHYLLILFNIKIFIGTLNFILSLGVFERENAIIHLIFRIISNCIVCSRVFHREDSAYTGYILVPYSSGINYLFLIRLIIKNRQAQLKNNFYSPVPSNGDFQKQLWYWKKIYVTFYYLIKLCGISSTNKFLLFSLLYFLSFEKRMTSENSEEIKEVTDFVASNTNMCCMNFSFIL